MYLIATWLTHHPMCPSRLHHAFQASFAHWKHLWTHSTSSGAWVFNTIYWCTSEDFLSYQNCILRTHVLILFFCMARTPMKSFPWQAKYSIPLSHYSTSIIIPHSGMSMPEANISRTDSFCSFILTLTVLIPSFYEAHSMQGHIMATQNTLA